jgi:hypothetical protein
MTMWRKIKKWSLTVFGDIKVFRWPMFMVYQPTIFRIKGEHTRLVMRILEPGDVVMRAYVDYLDGYFIPKGISGCSHTGVYIGDGQVVHMMAEGAVKHDIVDFCRCDRIVIMRPRQDKENAVLLAKGCLASGVPYDFDFKHDNSALYCHEFTASCFPGLRIDKISRSAFLGLKSPTMYLADSFLESLDFFPVYQGPS